MTATAESERKLVLNMLADGKISVEDAQRLLDKLRDIESSHSRPRPEARASKPRAKHLCIQSCDEHGDDDLNLRIPIGLVRAGLAVQSFLPDWATGTIVVGAGETDFHKIDSDYLRENLDTLDLSFDSEDGESLRIFSE
ncbi:MAG: hypothetical protein AAF560_26680 [Acidobacteriota bacterium]